MQNLTDIWREVSGWPAEERLALATHLLESLQQEGRSVAVSNERQKALQKLIGIWKTKQSPNDEQVERLVDHERMKKYG